MERIVLVYEYELLYCASYFNASYNLILRRNKVSYMLKLKKHLHVLFLLLIYFGS